MLLQRLHFLRRLPTNVAIYKLKERVEHSTRSFIFWILRKVAGENLQQTFQDGFWIEGCEL